MSDNNTRHNRRRKKLRFWKKHLMAWQRSGLTQADYCRQYKLSTHQFSYWKRSLGCEPKSRPPAFVQVPVPSLRDQHLPENGDSGLTVRLANGIRIELSRNFNVTALVQVVASLGGRA